MVPANRRMQALCRNLRTSTINLDRDTDSVAPQMKLAAGASVEGQQRGWDLSDEELYMFDTLGFLRY